MIDDFVDLKANCTSLSRIAKATSIDDHVNNLDKGRDCGDAEKDQVNLVGVTIIVFHVLEYIDCILYGASVTVDFELKSGPCPKLEQELLFVIFGIWYVIEIVWHTREISYTPEAHSRSNTLGAAIESPLKGLEDNPLRYLLSS